MLAVDLDVHYNRSDGSFTPTQLVDYACEKGLAAFAITDHDTIDGLEEAERYADMLRRDRAGDAAGEEGQNAAPWAKRLINDSGAAVPEVIPGIEFSTEYQGHDIHVLGLYIDYHNSAFVQKLRDFVDSRTLRNRKMCRLLTEAGLPVAYEALLAEFPDAVITRAHYAKYMLNHGYVKSMSDAFDRYIGDHCPCFVPREKVTPVDAVQLILSAGGIPILAHPVLYHMSDENLDTLTVLLAEAGLVALEAIYSTYTAFDERKMRALARKYNLLVSGGSDFHGANKPGLDLGTGYGSLYVPYSVLRDIKEVIKKDSHL